MKSIKIKEEDIESGSGEIRRELEAIAARKSGLTPQAVLQTAKNPKSCLHKYFDWDDTEAARKWREAQAYNLILRVKVTIETPEQKTIQVRAFVNVKKVDSDGTINHSERGHFVPIVQAMSDEEARSQVIAQARSELASFRRKYANLSELSEVIAAIDKTLLLPL